MLIWREEVCQLANYQNSVELTSLSVMDNGTNFNFIEQSLNTIYAP